MARKVIVDNDLLVILAGAGLFEDWLEACGISLADVHILASLQKMLTRRKGQLCKNHCQGTLDAAQRIADKLTPLPVADNELVAAFNNVADIDIGEQQIYAHLVTGDYIFAGTNDKKSIRALAANCELSSKVGNKIICLEQAICALLEHKGWEYVSAAIFKMFEQETKADKRPDARLICIFSPHSPSESNTHEALKSTLRQLLRECGSVLYPGWRGPGN